MDAIIFFCVFKASGLGYYKYNILTPPTQLDRLFSAVVRKELKQRSQRDISPPFEGGVVGKVDYLAFTEFYFPTGVVDSFISSYLNWYEK
jgi:hypothetical protein